MQEFRRDFLKMAGLSMTGEAITLLQPQAAMAQACSRRSATPGRELYFDIRSHGATGDGTTIDSPAINAAIDTAANAGGGTVILPGGTYASYCIRLKNNVAPFLQQGAILLAAPTRSGTGYDAPEPQNPARGSPFRTTATITGTIACSGMKTCTTSASLARASSGARVSAAATRLKWPARQHPSRDRQ